jgi:hypothetical protein
VPRVAVLGLLALALGGVATATSTATAPPPTPGTRIHTYNVVLRYHVRNTGFVERAGRREQAWTRDYRWSATFRNFKVRVSAVAGSRFSGSNAAGRPVRAIARVTEIWDYLSHPQALSPPDADCKGRTTARAPASLAVVVGSPTTPNFSLESRLSGGWDKSMQIRAVCDGRLPPAAKTRDFRLSDGTLVNGEIATLAIDFERSGGGRRVPAGELAVGRGFRFAASQTREQPTCEGACSGMLKIEERYTATFTARR